MPHAGSDIFCRRTPFFILDSTRTFSLDQLRVKSPQHVWSCLFPCVTRAHSFYVFCYHHSHLSLDWVVYLFCDGVAHTRPTTCHSFRLVLLFGHVNSNITCVQALVIKQFTRCFDWNPCSDLRVKGQHIRRVYSSSRAARQ